MSYSATNWVDGTTPVNASNLNKLEGGVADLSDSLDELNSNNMYTAYGTAINSNSDLNDVLTPGKYYCNSGSTAETLANCPQSAAGFSLYVIQNSNTANYRLQFMTASLRGNGNILYYRFYNGSAWGSWYLVNSSAVS